MLVTTAGVTSAGRLPDARAAIENLSAAAALLLRPVYGSQASAFAAVLPIGSCCPATCGCRPRSGSPHDRPQQDHQDDVDEHIDHRSEFAAGPRGWVGRDRGPASYLQAPAGCRGSSAGT